MLSILLILLIAGIVFLIIIKPIIGLSLICLTSPFILLQDIPSIPIGADQLFGLIVFFGLVGLMLVSKKKFIKTPLDLPIILLIFISFFSLLITTFKRPLQFQDFRSFSSMISIYILYFIVTNVIRSKKDFKIILYSLLGGGFLLSVVSLYFYFTGNRTPFPEIILMRGSITPAILRLQGFAGNPNSFATIFVFFLPVTLWMFYCEKKLSKKLLFSIFSILFILCIIFSFSRSAWIGLILGGIISLFFIKNFIKIPIYKLGILIFVIIGLVSFFLTNYGYLNTIKQRYSTFFRIGVSGEREYTYIGYAKMILNNPLGVGFGESKEHILEYSPVYHGTHSSILTFGTQGGILGLFAVLWLIIRQIKYSIWGIKNSAYIKNKLLMVGFLWGTIAFWIHSNFHSLHQWGIIWIFFAMGMLAIRIFSEKIISA